MCVKRHIYNSKYFWYDDQVDQHKNETPKKQAINVPSLASIEEMRTLFSQNILSEDYRSMEKRSTKQGHDEANNRTPFLEVNIWLIRPKKKALRFGS